ncbi:FGGY family carbohydrate kinase, partial [Acidocella sp.]|uniref:FGGY family carbohydrate kinase n=1 Tax=Acidocella sp. TaxID=50710 RepID=UPI0017CA38A3
MTKFLCGIDLGASSLKVSIINAAGEVAGEASAPVTTVVARPGWSEQDPAEWFAALCRAVPEALAAAGIGA